MISWWSARRVDTVEWEGTPDLIHVTKYRYEIGESGLVWGRAEGRVYVFNRADPRFLNGPAAKVLAKALARGAKIVRFEGAAAAYFEPHPAKRWETLARHKRDKYAVWRTVEMGDLLFPKASIDDEDELVIDQAILRPHKSAARSWFRFRELGRKIVGEVPYILTLLGFPWLYAMLFGHITLGTGLAIYCLIALLPMLINISWVGYRALRRGFW
ncbi:MAG: hypothetical protein P4M00_17060 [Azospirillaceae bacterium]|nr:hypothetical protein [Azospirillaceae bacterium]